MDLVIRFPFKGTGPHLFSNIRKGVSRLQLFILFEIKIFNLDFYKQKKYYIYVKVCKCNRDSYGFKAASGELYI